MQKFGIIGVLLIIIVIQLTLYTSGINPNSVILESKKEILPDIRKPVNSEEYIIAKELKDKFFEGCNSCTNNKLVQPNYKMIVHLVKE